MSSSSSPGKSYTLAGSPEWQRTEKCKPISELSHREREFIKDALTSEWEPDFTGTRVIYIEPEETDLKSMFSSNEEGEPERNDAKNSTTGLQSSQPNVSGKGRFKKMAKRLYPAKLIGGAKVAGGAIRHPMVTTRKVNQLVRRKGATESRNMLRGRVAGGTISATTEDLPPITRSATMTGPRKAPDGGSNSLSILLTFQ
jgi:hypothetical protein